MHGNEAVLDAIKEATTSCQKWGHILKSLFVEESLEICRPDKLMRSFSFDMIEQELRAGKAILVHVGLPKSTDHVFTIEKSHVFCMLGKASMV